MHIFVDESGTFAKSKSQGSWCVVAAYVIPEVRYTAAKEVLRRFKLRCGVRHDVEIKRKDVDESRYFELLAALEEVDGIGVAVATDSSLNAGAEEHKEQQARKIEEYAPNMIYPEGRQMLLNLANDLRRLSEQNYVELVCRVTLVYDVLQLAINYYVQRLPAALSHFRWSFDRKPNTALLVKCFRERQPGVNLFDAHFIDQSIRSKYGMKPNTAYGAAAAPTIVSPAGSPSAGEVPPVKGPVDPAPADYATMVLSAQRVSTQMGCGDVHSAGGAKFQASCRTYSVIIDCHGDSCRPIRSLNN